jgi:hypothetical protein
MDQGTTLADSGVDVKSPRTMADQKCDDCFGRGVRFVIRPSSNNRENLPEVCHCVVKFLKAHPVLLLQFLRMRGELH